MTPAEAKRILLCYRPHTGDAQDPAIAAALQQVGRDPELQQWLEQHLVLQETLRRKFRAVPVPARLKETILAESRMRQQSFWRRPFLGPQPIAWQRPAIWLAAAAALVLLLGVTVVWLRPQAPDRFADFRARMVRTALRQYSMDIVTNDAQQVRQFMAARGAPADYVVPAGLQRLSLTGGGFLKWRSAPVAMVCFDRGDQQMLYLFVLDRAQVKDAPPAAPQVAQVNKLVTASWSQGDRTYVLAGPAEADFAKKYL